MTIPHKAICPRCKATVPCAGVRVTLASHYAHGCLCLGAHLDLNPGVEDTYTTRVPSFRERFPTLQSYVDSCRPLWVACQEDDARKET